MTINTIYRPKSAPNVFRFQPNLTERKIEKALEIGFLFRIK